MLHRILALIAIATLSVAASPPPAVLAPYIHDGRFDPGDYGWMRGAFGDAEPGQKATWREILAWREDCGKRNAETVRDELARRGVTVAKIERQMGTGLCSSVAYATAHPSPDESWSVFQAAVSRAGPIAQTVIWSAALAQQVADPDHPDDASLLVARPMTDQVLRQALSWGQGGVAGAPPLDAPTQNVVQSILWSAIAVRDHANTDWLKSMIASKGWPSIGKVGSDASHYA